MARDRRFTIPPAKFGAKWTCVLDTDHNLEYGEMVAAVSKVDVAARSTVMLTRPMGVIAEHSIAQGSPVRVR